MSAIHTGFSPAEELHELRDVTVAGGRVTARFDELPLVDVQGRHGFVTELLLVQTVNLTTTAATMTADMPGYRLLETFQNVRLRALSVDVFDGVTGRTLRDDQALRLGYLPSPDPADVPDADGTPSVDVVLHYAFGDPAHEGSRLLDCAIPLAALHSKLTSADNVLEWTQAASLGASATPGVVVSSVSAPRVFVVVRRELQPVISAIPRLREFSDPLTTRTHDRADGARASRCEYLVTRALAADHADAAPGGYSNVTIRHGTQPWVSGESGSVLAAYHFRRIYRGPGLGLPADLAAGCLPIAVTGPRRPIADAANWPVEVRFTRSSNVAATRYISRERMSWLPAEAEALRALMGVRPDEAVDEVAVQKFQASTIPPSLVSRRVRRRVVRR